LGFETVKIVSTVETWFLKLSRLRLSIKTLSRQIDTPRLISLRDDVFVEIIVQLYELTSTNLDKRNIFLFVLKTNFVLFHLAKFIIKLTVTSRLLILGFWICQEFLYCWDLVFVNIAVVDWDHVKTDWHPKCFLFVFFVTVGTAYCDHG
jgi:hypothetical protein